MFGLSMNEKIIKKQNEYIAKLESENKHLKSSVDFNNRLEIGSCDFVIDFEKMNAFSIERVPNSLPNDNGVYKTTIGYLLNGEVREWVLWCSLTQHNILAQDFREYMKVEELSKGKKK